MDQIFGFIDGFFGQIPQYVKTILSIILAEGNEILLFAVMLTFVVSVLGIIMSLLRRFGVGRRAGRGRRR